MILTEEKAKEKFCHRNWIQWCIVSECMAWRWHDEINKMGYCGLVYKDKA